MAKKTWELIGLWAMGLILFIATLIIIRWTVDFATWTTIDSGWLQAIGGVGAIVVALWIATSQSRAQARQERDKALIVAAKLVPEIERLIGVVISFGSHLVHAMDNLGTATADETTAALLNAPIARIDSDDLLMLVPLGGSHATQLSHTLGAIAAIQEHVREFMEKNQKGGPLPMEVLKDWSKRSIDARERLFVVHRACSAAIREHTRQPTVHEVYGLKEPD